jgi:hypothetical protein
MDKRVKKRKNGPCVRVYSEQPRPLPKDQLPLWRDVDLAVQDAQDNLNLSKADSVRKVASEIVEIYKRASITTIDSIKIVQKVNKMLQLRRNRVKNLAVDQRTGKTRDQGKWKQKRKNNQKNKVKLEEVMDSIFEVKKQVPGLEKEFYEDQLRERKFFIGPLDVSVTEDNEKKFEDEIELSAKK